MIRSIIFLFATVFLFSSTATGQEKFKLLINDESTLQVLKEQFISKSGNEQSSRADRALLKGPYSVTFKKTKIAPSGDIHDYLSQAPYWWPDPSKANGEPYIRKDGRRNPEIYKLNDRAQIGDLTSTLNDLALGYYLSGEEKYAKRANELLAVFFVDTATRMNPSLTFAQYVPGLNDGRGIGIIETRGLIDIPEAIALMQKSKSLNPETVSGVKNWFSAYLSWLTDSANGKSERLEKNNHGTNYDLQVIDFALFLDNKELAERTLTSITIPRLDVQFDTDGRQPLETARTNSWDYVNMNLDAWMKIAKLAQHVGIDLYHTKNKNNVGLQKAVEWLIPYLEEKKKWPYQQLNKFNKDQALSIVQRATKVYPSLK